MPAKPTAKQPPISSPSSTDSKTDWKRLRELEDHEIDDTDIPEPTPEQFARAVARRGLRPLPKKEQVTLRLDADVLAWFRGQGRGYQSRINALLREYMRAHEGGEE